MQFPPNVKVFEGEQGTDEWRQARLGIPTASKAGAFMAKTKAGAYTAARKDYITELALERITGELTEFIVTEAMQEGTDRERTAALAYEFETGHQTEQVGFLYTELCGASPDNLVVGLKKGVEYKNPKPATHLMTLTTQTVPPYYYWQVLQNLYVTGYDEWDYVSFHPLFPPEAQLFIKTIKRAEVLEDIQKLETELNLLNQEIDKQVKFVANYSGAASVAVTRK